MAAKPLKPSGRRGSEPSLEDILKVQLKLSEDRQKEMMENFNAKIREDILMAVQGLSKKIEGLEEEMQQISQSNKHLEDKMQGVQKKVDQNEDQVVILQYKLMEGALRIRGMQEQRGEDLRKIISDALAEFIEVEPQEVAYQIDKIYRANSWIARQRKLPRDIVVYFVKRTMRNQILQVSYQTTLKIGEQELKVLKEIPSKMLRDRKEFVFFTQELKKYQIQFRWEVPVGLTVFYQGRRYRIDTVLKAKDFLSTVLKVEIEVIEKLQDIQEGVVIQEASLLPASEEPQEQRVTREALKRKEEQQFQSKSQDPSMEAVGGARRKIPEEDLLLFASKLQEASNGK
ncbi:arf-GAP with GTPase, ANK repeat and PH domain-containing protein 1 isoform X1 [Ahaetulla prasina]|uniref:arf-GAP with GTPase, ANK repeat and PH domain-containing protein 1 isoform X1 n=1 Tax=Ahaetulla prasina TaxID=499056 RepID=UPI0026480A50|nr:arf-GAP with GTPase, ANK repeat and PH domain-containing protein 1 isoform X1 [Ahaetulla prasina]